MSGTARNTATHVLRRTLIGASALMTLAAITGLHTADAATATWSPEAIIASKLPGGNRVVNAVSPSGVAVMAWDKYLGTDATHPYGIFQVYAAGRTAAGVWSAPVAISAADADTAGATVDPASGALRVFYTSGGVSYAAQSGDFGGTWSTPEAIPADAGFAIPASPGTQVGGPWVGVDGAGNTTVMLLKQTSARPAIFQMEVATKAAAGAWSGPTVLTGPAGATPLGSIGIHVISDGQALANVGFATWRRLANGTWEGEKDVIAGGFGQIFSSSAALDASGKAYFAFRTHYVSAQVSTELPGGTWTAPKRANRLEMLGSSLQLAASSSGHVMAYGQDYNSGAIRASVSGDGAATWGPLTSFGAGQNPQAAGSENGLFALAWDGAGPAFNRYFVAAGTGIAGATTAWAKTNLVGAGATGPVAIAGTSGQSTATALAGWLRPGGAGLGLVLGAKAGAISP